MITLEHLTGLTRLAQFSQLMGDNSSSLEKARIIANHAGDAFIVKALTYTYSPYKKFGVHRETAEKNPELSIDHYSDLFGLLDDLAERRLTGHNAIATVNGFAAQLDTMQRDTLFMILDKDLKMRASASVINKVIPGCIPTFSVALAQAHDPKYVDFDRDVWFGSQKLDGVRCICRKEGSTITFFSRSGHEFYTLGKVAEQVAKIEGDCVLDGEICLVDKNGVEDFQGIMKQIKRKDHTILRPMYLLFDILTLEEFDTEGIGATLPLSDRLVQLEQVISSAKLDQGIIKMVLQLPMNNETFKELSDRSAELGWEGIMIRKNIPYQGKRTNNLLKVKQFCDAEYVVTGAHMGPIRWVEGGREVERECLSYITIEHKGYEVRVGSGFSKEERELYHQHPEQVIGRTVTVKYFQESVNQDGGISLRFPTIKHIFEGNRTT